MIWFGQGQEFSIELPDNWNGFHETRGKPSIRDIAARLGVVPTEHGYDTTAITAAMLDRIERLERGD